MANTPTLTVHIASFLFVCFCQRWRRLQRSLMSW